MDDNNIINTLKKEHRAVYSGVFEDKNGNPDFKGIGPILKGLFYLFILSLIISKNITTSIIFLILCSLGQLINAMRYYYVNTLINDGSDEYFINMNMIEEAVEAGVFFFVALYLLSHKVLLKI